MQIPRYLSVNPFAPCFLACLLLCLAQVATAQNNGYESGYIISLEGDTIQGLVRDRSAEPFVEILNRIRFKGPNKSKRKYGPEDILGYKAGNRVYESLPVREDAAFFRFRYYVEPGAEQTFLRVIRRKGNLTWYHQEFVHDDNDFLDYYPLFHLEGSRQMVRVTQGVLGLKRERLQQYFEGCPELVEVIRNKELTEVEAVFRFYQERCLDDAAIPSGGESLIGIWTIDLRPTPDAEPYFQNFQVDRISGNTFQGSFYGSIVEDARLNRNWGKLYFAFTTRDQNHAYYHSGYMENGKLSGISYCPGRDFVAPWTGVRD